LQPKDALDIVKRPYVTEKTFDAVEKENRVAFIVADSASKRSVKDAVELLYSVKVVKVNTARTIYGKKAYVRLAPENSAADLASKLGVL
jgi:large subunit ribosomal protein L23